MRCYPQIPTHKRAPSTHLVKQWSTGYKTGSKEQGITRAAHHVKSTSLAPPTGLDPSTHYSPTTAPPLHGRPQKQSANSVESAGKFTNPRPKCRVVSGGYSGVMACDVTRAHALEPRHSARALPYSAEWRCSPDSKRSSSASRCLTACSVQSTHTEYSYTHVHVY